MEKNSELRKCCDDKDHDHNNLKSQVNDFDNKHKHDCDNLKRENDDNKRRYKSEIVTLSYFHYFLGRF